MEIRVSLKEKKVFIRSDSKRELCITLPEDEDVIIKLPEDTTIDLETLLKSVFKEINHERT